MTERELMQQALDALESDCGAKKFGASEALRARLAQPEPEPVAWTTDIEFDEDTEVIPAKTKGKIGTNIMNIPLYIVQPQRKWQGLTDEDVKSIVFVERSWADAVRKVEAKLKEKNAPDL